MVDLLELPLHALHIELEAKMVPFAGYEMPVQYPLGVMKEHLHCRAACGLFDVSHMGQVLVRGPGGNGAQEFENLVPVNIADLPEGRQRYAFFTNDDGGIMDDLMVANRGDHLFVVVNAACKPGDIAHMRDRLVGCEIDEVTDRSLLALQGPMAEAVMAEIVPAAAGMRFMDVIIAASEFGELWISRSGYTGEDGYEVSVSNDQAEAFTRAVLADERVEPIGLGARNSLRLEAGLCLYGSDIDAGTSPSEANLNWAIQKIRRLGGAREGRFPGAERVLNEVLNGADRCRVGILPQGRAPMRAGVEIFAEAEGGDAIGVVTSGAFGPSIGAPMSMAYVPREWSATGTHLYGEVRGTRMPVLVAQMPFLPANFKR